MDYKKKHKEEVVRATQLWECGDITRENLEYIFPELKESEDERIRKECISIIDAWDKSCRLQGDYCEVAPKCIAWLEKQGEYKKEINKFEVLPGLYKCVHRMFDGTPESRLLFEVGNVYKCLSKHDRAEFEVSYGHSVYLEDPVVCKHFIPYEKQGEQKPAKNIVEIWKDMRLEVYQQASGNRHEPNYSDDTTKMFSLNDIDEIIEKMSEQKPADKVEPKFKVGDWIVQENIGVYKVIEVCESWYEVIDIEDNHYSISFDKEYMCHLWTVQDAKDGDVLASEDKDKVFIYNGKLDLRGRVCAYCGIYKTHDGLRFTECAVGNYFTYKEPYPATKEQRDQLEKAMADAGYTFDFEKKELKKIEPFGKYEGLTDFERTLADICIGWIGQEYGWKKYIKDNADILLKIAVEKFNSVQDATFEQKPADWSEEDEENLQGIIAEIEANKHSGPVYDIPTYDRFLSWLKSIRPQNHWKPTEAQLASLTIACDRNDRIGFDLTQLLEELKKL